MLPDILWQGMMALGTVEAYLAQVQKVAGIGIESQGFRGGQHEVGSVKVLQAAAESAESGIGPSIAAWHGEMPVHVPPLRGRRLRQVSAQRQAVPESLQSCSCRHRVRLAQMATSLKSAHNFTSSWHLVEHLLLLKSTNRYWIKKSPWERACLWLLQQGTGMPC